MVEQCLHLSFRSVRSETIHYNRKPDTPVETYLLCVDPKDWVWHPTRALKSSRIAALVTLVASLLNS